MALLVGLPVSCLAVLAMLLTIWLSSGDYRRAALVSVPPPQHTCRQVGLHCVYQCSLSHEQGRMPNLQNS